jgi:hypothetical protein
MSAIVVVHWDFDSALGQLNATAPYHFRKTPLQQELDGVGLLADLAARVGFPMTFATAGFAAEDHGMGYGARDLLARLHRDGHEIASHSWRHEWFPHLKRNQVRRSLLRSKLALEDAIGEVGGVTGFVPPFNRPMTWPSQGSFHPGDNWAFPQSGARTIGALLKEAAGAGYRWMRVNPAAQVGSRWSGLAPARLVGSCVAVPHHHNGFDDAGVAWVDRAEREGRTLFLSGHPAGLFRARDEREEIVVAFVEEVARRRDAGRLEVRTTTDAVASLLPVGASR